jgi:hypothetical protein
MNQITEAFHDCLDRAQAETQPYPYWLLEDVLTTKACEGLLDLPVEPPQLERHNGKRDTHNQTRTYINAETCSTSATCRELVEALSDPATVAKLEKTCGIDLSEGNLRIEYTQDCDGFWLEPHTDISVKLFTMLVYLSSEPELADAGTDIYDSDHNHVGRAPFAQNLGLIFIPGKDTWHGFAKRPLKGVRRSIIVNFVHNDWREKWQLAPC